MNKSNRAKNPSNPLYFVRIVMIAIVFLLVMLQISYFLLERSSVELIVAPIIFIITYSVILFVSVRYSAIHNKGVNLVSQSSPKHIESLSDRENQVLRLIAEGKTDKEISEEIHLSPNTVKTYCKRIYTKLHLKNRIEAANHYNSAPN